MKICNPTYRMLIVGLFSLALLVPSCSKDDKDEQSSKTKLLTQDPWIMTASTVDPGFPTIDAEGNIGIDNDIFWMLDDCQKDDTRQFNTDKSLVSDEGLTKCESSDPQTKYGTWSFNTDETMLTIAEEGEIQTVTIVEITQSVLKVKSIQSSGGKTYTYTLTFSH